MFGLAYLLFYFWWLLKKRPHHRYVTYRFVKCGFRIRLDRWKNMVVTEA